VKRTAHGRAGRRVDDAGDGNVLGALERAGGAERPGPEVAVYGERSAGGPARDSEGVLDGVELQLPVTDVRAAVAAP
jgi:hypothetical protein